jgi:hypothetical protein
MGQVLGPDFPRRAEAIADVERIEAALARAREGLETERCAPPPAPLAEWRRMVQDGARWCKIEQDSGK